MKTLTIDHNNGHKTTYKLIDGGKDLPIAYHQDTPKGVIDALENARQRGQKVKIYYGDIDTGRNWNETYNVTGTIGLSRGKDAMYPLMIATARSHGGPQILTHCIIKIKVGSYTVYQNPKFQDQKIEIEPADQESKSLGYTHTVLINGKLESRHKSYRSAKIMRGKLI